ncbi:MAG: hypothetical protein HC767_09745 [Akkermansiaceae bacterium]|nr:hypothetical protein [Akkermansiaceae bacterium]
MDTQLEKIYSHVDHDLSAEWLDLSTRVRHLVGQIQNKAKGTILAEDAAILAVDASKLCDHVERVHLDVGKLLIELDQQMPEMDFTPSNVDPAEIQRETIQIHRESHEMKANFKDVIKALFMWQDDPMDRVREKKVD